MKTRAIVGATAALGTVLGLAFAFTSGTRSVDAPPSLEMATAADPGDGGLTGASEGMGAAGANDLFAPTPLASEPVAPTAEAVVEAEAEAPAVITDTPLAPPIVDVPMEAPPAPPALMEEETFSDDVGAPAPEAFAPPVAEAPASPLPPQVTPAVPALDPMLAEFARVTLSVMDLADAYRPTMESARAAGTDGPLREELARETRIVIEEEFAWGFDAYIQLTQEVRRNPAWEADVAREMARLRP